MGAHDFRRHESTCIYVCTSTHLIISNLRGYHHGKMLPSSIPAILQGFCS